MFDTVLICNRGEIAVRIIRTCRKLGIRAVVAHSAADTGSLAVRMADETFCLGPARPVDSYLNIPAVLYACAKTGADAVHPGYGFLSEDSSFARVCGDAGITFIGPPAEVIALLGDKIAGRASMGRAQLPVLPGSPGPIRSEREAAAVADEIGFPLALKAAAGGGGRGIAVVRSHDELREAFARIRATARALFNDDRVFVEKFVEPARHIEVQILADHYGNVIHLGERECSVQRNRQKLVEESPAPALSDAQREALCAAAVSGASTIGYRSAGTFEFLVDDAGEAYFLEANTRLQVEHPITEARTGIDIVEQMIRIAAGERMTLTQDDVQFAGHAVEARINAENPARDWVPAPGTIGNLRLPDGQGVRVDTHIFDGYVVQPFYDSLLAKIIVLEPTRKRALRLLDGALGQFRCAGLDTNVEFHRRLLADPRFAAGDYRLNIAEAVAADMVAADGGMVS